MGQRRRNHHNRPPCAFDDTGIKSCYVNACNVASTREEVVLNFGLNHTWKRGQSDAQMQVMNRMIFASPGIKPRRIVRTS